jgi:hypothetical protein
VKWATIRSRRGFDVRNALRAACPSVIRVGQAVRFTEKRSSSAPGRESGPFVGRIIELDRHAIRVFDEVAAIRRETLDYRGMVKALAKAAEACERAGRGAAASRRYLRAGQSTALQGNLDQAQIWLARAVQLADQVGDETLAQEARLQLTQLQKKQPAMSGDYASGKEGP